MKAPSPLFERWLVFSDLDGTLLNHHDYGFDSALPLLQKLDAMGIPVIINTSKTRAELNAWSQRLQNRHPFIIENGSAVIIPADYFPQQPLAQLQQDPKHPGQFLLQPGTPIAVLREFVQRVRPNAIDLTRCSLDQAMQLTNLSRDDARMAQARDYSIPLLFARPDDAQSFSSAAEQAGLHTLKGGRFLHLLGQCDKGASLQALKQLYQSVYQTDFGIIALGDSPNDLDMLQQADHAIIVHSPSSQQLNFNHPSCYRTQQTAPNGWVEGVESFLNGLSINFNIEERGYGR
jgi:mannosyl-3-phosphoglycerate phosphatase